MASNLCSDFVGELNFLPVAYFMCDMCILFFILLNHGSHSHLFTENSGKTVLKNISAFAGLRPMRRRCKLQFAAPDGPALACLARAQTKVHVYNIIVKAFCMIYHILSLHL